MQVWCTENIPSEMNQSHKLNVNASFAILIGIAQEGLIHKKLLLFLLDHFSPLHSITLYSRITCYFSPTVSTTLQLISSRKTLLLLSVGLSRLLMLPAFLCLGALGMTAVPPP